MFINIQIFVYLGLFVLVAGNGKIANKFFLTKQKFLFEILLRVEDPLLNEHWIDMGKTLDTNQTDYFDYNNDMIRFYHDFLQGNLLNKQAFFSPLIKSHYEQSKALFFYFYNAKDWIIFQQNVCFARLHVNPGMFVYTLTQVLLKREDFKGLIMPKIYEILPQHFLPAKFVWAMEKFDYGTWREWDSSKPMEFCVKTELIEQQRSFSNASLWEKAMEEVNVLCANVTTELKADDLSYLTEDENWNAYWYYMNMGLMLVDQLEMEVKMAKLREWWLWNLSQMVKRYELERYAKGLRPLRSDKKLFNAPKMMSWMGAKFRSMEKRELREIQNFLNDLQNKVQQALSEGSFQSENGLKLRLQESQNFDQFIAEYFSFDHILTRMFGSIAKADSLLANYETMGQGAHFYYFAMQLLKPYEELKAHFQPYKPHDLVLTNLKFNNVEVEPLITSFQSRFMDISNLLNLKHFYYAGQLLWEKSLQARQRRLQHQPFRMQFNISSKEPQAVVIRTFLTQGKAEQLHHFQLDAFVTLLVAGHNIVQRSSQHFFGTAHSQSDYTAFYRHVVAALDDQFEFWVPMRAPNCGFPNRLLLPQGRKEGLSMQLVFVATPYGYGKGSGDNFACDYANGILAYDAMPYGFPFDRGMEREQGEEEWPNWHRENVKIYHIEE